MSHKTKEIYIVMTVNTVTGQFKPHGAYGLEREAKQVVRCIADYKHHETLDGVSYADLFAYIVPTLLTERVE